ncbi:MAG: hypothetical protein J3K34DRAFT_390542 [Monoraphidium minutum]|nr:MAG: hypothetical protein J3K34DRAFT_390542 [Monoraphidium minutum]
MAFPRALQAVLDLDSELAVACGSSPTPESLCVWERCLSSLSDLVHASGGAPPATAALRALLAALARMLRDAATRDVDQLRAYVAVSTVQALLKLCSYEEAALKQVLAG